MNMESLGKEVPENKILKDWTMLVRVNEQSKIL